MGYQAVHRYVPKRKLVWPHPTEHEVALSVDGSFQAVDGSAGSGMILRDSTGAVILASYRKMFHCNDALEAELHAIKEGLQLATEHSQATLILQSDCEEALKMIADAFPNRSAYGHLVADIREYMNIRAFVPVKILREQNRITHCLANFARCGDSTAFWLGRPPPCIRS
ncbi:Autophagy-related protein 7 [Hordeum vulgare]|nr:Autophagy-related protein 7 [Hordeum vulgare]